MKKILLIIYLIFAIAIVLSEIVLNFKETRSSFSSLNYEQNYLLDTLYVKEYDRSPSGNSYGITCINGYSKRNPNKVLRFRVSDDDVDKYRKFIKDTIYYYDMWYDKKTGYYEFKTSDKGGIYYNGFILIIFCAFIPFAIYSLIKIKKS